MATRMQQRRGTQAQWSTTNPILADGELGLERDTGVVKIGDGLTPWNDLAPALAGTYVLASTFASHDAQVESNTTGIANLDTRVSALSADVASLQTDIEAVGGVQYQSAAGQPYVQSGQIYVSNGGDFPAPPFEDGSFLIRKV